MGPLGYQVVQEVAASNLALGLEVVIDLADPLPETGRMWRELATRTASELVVFQCAVPDVVEHRRPRTVLDMTDTAAAVTVARSRLSLCG